MLVFGWVGERGPRCGRDAVAVAAVVSLGRSSRLPKFLAKIFLRLDAPDQLSIIFALQAKPPSTPPCFLLSKPPGSSAPSRRAAFPFPPPAAFSPAPSFCPPALPACCFFSVFRTSNLRPPRAAFPSLSSKPNVPKRPANQIQTRLKRPLFPSEEIPNKPSSTLRRE